ncbi:hypothetical protein HGA91_06130 [candidate division WWE3 bacterium]|nr:hypothetical protein [candidate division WWE3 bacterium]
MNRYLRIFLLIIVIGLAVSGLILASPFIIATFNTNYPSKFKQATFDSIKNGQTQDQVFQSIGAPIQTNYNFGTTYLLYTTPKKNTYYNQRLVVLQGGLVKEKVQGIQVLNQ